MRLIIAATLLMWCSSAIARDVCEEPIKLEHGPPACVDGYDHENLMPPSGWIGDVYYDAESEHLVMDLTSGWYQYCEVPDEIWEDLKAAKSPGGFYNESIKGQYPCG